MLVLNKSKRNIDGIKPLQTKDIDCKEAKKLSNMYIGEIEIIEVSKKDNKKK